MHRSLPTCLLIIALTVQARPEPAAQPAFADPGIAPDGSEIAFVSGGDIWTVPAAGGDARLLVSSAATESRPVYSPDKKQMAFVSTRTGGGDIYVLTFASGDLRRVTYDDGAEQLDGWSRDGKWLYFFSNGHDLSGGMNDVYRVAAEGGTPMAVSGDRYANEFFSAVSPDGKTLALSARGNASGQWWRHGHSHLDEAEIWLRDLTAADAPAAWRALTNGGAKDLWPMWAGDGASLFFMSDRSGAENIWQLATAHGSSPRQITRFTGGRVLWPSATARADTIVFERNFRIWKLDTASGKSAEVPIARMGAPAGPAVEHLRLTNQFQDLSLSPDGKKVAFAARGEIFAASAKDGGDAARVTMTAAAEGQVAWSPDSRKLVYSSEKNWCGPARALRLRLGEGDRIDDGQRGRLRGAILARRQVARVRARRHRAARAGSRREEGALARQGAHRRSDPGRPPDRVVARRQVARLLHRGRARLHQRLGGRQRGRRAETGQLSRQRKRHRRRLVARRHVPAVRHRPANRSPATRPRRSDPAHPEVPRGSI